MGFAEDIKNVRQQGLLSQEDFADKLGVAFTTVNRWENGRSLPNYKARRAINEFCKERDINYDITWGIK